RPGSPNRGRRGASARAPPRSSTRRTPSPPARRRSARSAAPAPAARSSLLLSLGSLASVLEILADGVEEALPAIALVLYPLRGLGKRLGTKREAVRSSVDQPRDHAGLLEQLQVPRDRRLRHPEVAACLADRGGAAAEPLDDVAADRMREGTERIISH